jgi:integrase
MLPSSHPSSQILIQNMRGSLIMALTDLGIRKLKKPARGRREKWDREIPGLAIRITENGIRSFNFVYSYGVRTTSGGRVAPHRFRITLGRFGELTLEEAREQARELRKRVRAGGHPAVEDKINRAVAATTRPKLFRELVEVFDKRALATSRTGQPVRLAIAKYLLPVWKDLPVAAITRQHVIEVVENLVDDKPGMARRLFEISRRMFNWAVQRGGYLAQSPCALLSAKNLIGKQVARDRVLSDREIRALVRAVQNLGHPYYEIIVLLLLTGLRRNEVAHGRWEELDLAGKSWEISSERMKSGRPHALPMSRGMIKILESLPRKDAAVFLFPGPSGGGPFFAFSWLKAAIDKKMAIELRREDPTAEFKTWRLHDIRRSFRTRLSSLPVPGGDVTRELLLAHSKKGLHAVYDQHSYWNERLAGYQLWEQRLDSILAGRSADVIELATQRADERLFERAERSSTPAPRIH